MDRAAGAIASQSGEVQRFHHHALAGKGRVAMQQHRQATIDHFFARDARLHRSVVLSRAHHSFDHRIDRLEVTGIRRKSQLHFLPLRGFAFADGALVILHVAFVGRETTDELNLRTHAKMRSQNCPITFASTFRRPRWAMPIVMSSTPRAAAPSIN